MATGGTIPSGRKQYVYFYNTHGVIEKDKQMYFAPIFNEDHAGLEVSEAFLELFEEVCPPSSAYSRIEISTWSPQDRTLVVKGNIDDFRLITDEGACLNYFLVMREVTKGEGQQASTATYYYAFFITGVEQIGGSSVKITAEPDDFTNVFYLHNTHVLSNVEAVSGSYEPFNERMKNCYVNRQHYNRVTWAQEYYILHCNIDHISPTFNPQIGDTINIEFEGAHGEQVEGEIVDCQSTGTEAELWIKTFEEIDIEASGNWSQMLYNGVVYQFDYDVADIDWEEYNSIIPANMKIFLNQEDSFKFKYQYRDERRPFALADVFTQEELNTIKNEDTFSNLSQNLRKKIVKSCIQYLAIELKSQERVGRVGYAVNTDPVHYNYPEFKNMIRGFKREGPVVFSPFINVPDIFLKYSELTKYGFKLVFSRGTAVKTISTASYIYQKLNDNALADFIFSAYIVDDMLIPSNLVDVDLTNKMVKFNVLVSDTPFATTVPALVAFPLNLNSSSLPDDGFIYGYADYDEYQREEPSSLTIENGCEACLMLSGYDSRDISINISETIPNLKSSYYDPVLEAEPYSFYSLSHLSYELPFNKNRYYLDNEIYLRRYTSVNGAIKLAYIPSYNVENKKFSYFNEGIVFTLPSVLPLVSDSYASYYYQNQAQMKNQFAVNDYNRGVDLAQHFFISGPNAVGMSASKRGWVGAVTETGNQFMEMADEAIDWSQSNKVIEMNQKAKLADMGAKPDNVKQTGSDSFYDLVTGENRPYFNHYTIDEKSYQTIAKFLERFGYQVNLYDNLNTIDRVGWNFVKLNSFDWNPAPQYDIMIEQEDSIKKIFLQGVTLLHDTYYLTAGHNYEAILDY